MKIATWNVNSIRTRLNQVLDWMNQTKPNVLCIQETKVNDSLFPIESFTKQGYKVSFYGQKAYNGVAIISSSSINDVRFGFEGELNKEQVSEKIRNQKRVISALINDIRIVNLYVPNGSEVNSEKFFYKLEWLECLYKYLNVLGQRNEPLCIVGDFNIALEARDIYNPTRLEGGIMASNQERKALSKALGNDLKDVFRIFESNSKHWSWWNYRTGAWDRDHGWRIDHIYLSQELIDQAQSCLINKETRGNEKPSDHAPVICEIAWPPSPNEIEEDSFLLY